MTKKLHILLLYALLLVPTLAIGCKDDNVEDPGTPDSPVAEDVFSQMNRDIADMQLLAEGNVKILTCFVEADGSAVLELDNGHILNVYAEKEESNIVPVVGIDKDGYWVYTLDGKSGTLNGSDGQPAAALSSTGKTTVTPQFRINDKKYWEVSFNGSGWSQLGNRQVWNVEKLDASAFSPFAACTADGNSATLSLRCGSYEIHASVEGKETTEAWNKFVAGTDDNVLLDFSYAGYKHGEEAPADGFAWGYEVENVKEYMDANPGISARQAFIKILEKHNLVRTENTGQYATNANARIVIYFPEGDYVLHNDDDNSVRTPDDNNTYPETDSKGNNASNTISILGGNFIIKGDGPDKTRLIMETPMLPDNETMYSSPTMIAIRSYSFLGKSYNVTGSAAKGTFSVDVKGASNFKVGEYVCLYLQNDAPTLVAQEIQPYEVESTFTNLINTGVQVQDFHQIVGIQGNTVTFKEPIMHEVDPQWGWELRKYSYYENVGVEDLAFVGDGVTDFKHHRNWNDDGAYKPLDYIRLVNSWIRNVKYTNVSEATSIVSCANCSAYNIEIDGTGGHAAIRSQGSSRVFIGAVRDHSNRPLADEWSASNIVEGAGQYHACGVSKQSMGAVIWRVSWGSDACFEAHATQPRATLIDNCTGGFMQTRQGGDAAQVPNHLADLTIWNMNSTNSPAPKGNGNVGTEFDWWRSGWKYWKILPPVIVGFHGDPVTFVQDQVKLDESNGTPVEPQSLYEAQLKKRLGHVPAWLNALK